MWCHILMVLGVLLAPALGQDWELVWSDEFDGNAIDLTKWQYEITAGGGGNGEFQVYTPDPANSFVRDGLVIIKPTLLEENTNPQTGEPYGQDFLYNGVLDLNELYGGCTDGDYEGGCYREGAGQGQWLNINPVASARLRTYERFSFRYGRVEVRAKMPVGDWLWPAMWMLPENWCYGGWPRSGEIDIVECIGNEDLRWPDGAPHGMQRMASTMHWGMRYDDNRYYLTGLHRDNETSDYGNNFHIYAMEWSENGLSFFIDDFRLLDVPYPLIDENPDWNGFFEWGKPWNTIDEDDPSQNPWLVNNNPDLVPFDTEFHFILNIAVGGTNSFISDDAINRGGDEQYKKPWGNWMGQSEAMTSFYDGREGWLWNWDEQEADNDNLGLHVDYIRVYKHSGLPPDQDNDCPAA